MRRFVELTYRGWSMDPAVVNFDLNSTKRRITSLLLSAVIVATPSAILIITFLTFSIVLWLPAGVHGLHQHLGRSEHR